MFDSMNEWETMKISRLCNSMLLDRIFQIISDETFSNNSLLELITTVTTSIGYYIITKIEMHQ